MCPLAQFQEASPPLGQQRLPPSQGLPVAPQVLHLPGAEHKKKDKGEN